MYFCSDHDASPSISFKNASSLLSINSTSHPTLLSSSDHCLSLLPSRCPPVVVRCFFIVTAILHLPFPSPSRSRLLNKLFLPRRPYTNNPRSILSKQSILQTVTKMSPSDTVNFLPLDEDLASNPNLD